VKIKKQDVAAQNIQTYSVIELLKSFFKYLIYKPCKTTVNFKCKSLMDY